MGKLTSFAIAMTIFAMSPAVADTITQDITFSGSAQNPGNNFITGSLFNPSLGTLTGVTADISGQWIENLYVSQVGAPQITATLNGSLATPGGQSISGALGTFLLTAVSPNLYTGDTSFNVNVNLGSLTALDSYISGSPNAGNFLAELGLYDSVPCCLGGADDFSTYLGSFDLTYTYDVSEPSTLLLMAAGGAVLLMAMRLGRRPA